MRKKKNMPLNLYITKIKSEEISSHIKKKSSLFLKNKFSKIISDLFIRKILSEELECDLNAIKITTNKYGKPFLKGKKRHFNLSNSKDLMLLATDSDSVGVDLEYIAPIEDLDYLITNFSHDEKKFLLSKNKKKQLEHFYELWTLKESYIKALGCGLNRSLNSFSILFKTKKIILSDFQNPKFNKLWFFKKYNLYGQYKCAVCSKNNKFPQKPIEIDANELLTLLF